MKLTFPDWSHQIEFREDMVQLLVIESPSLLFQYVKDLYDQCNNALEGRFILSDEEQIIPLVKNACMILNPFEIDINNRRIITKLYSELKELAFSENLYMETNQILADMGNYIEKLEEDSEYAMEYNQEIDITGFFKLFDLKLRKEYETVLEQLIDYIEIMQKILHMNLCICVNLKSYLSEEELRQLYDMMRHRKMYLLLIENREAEQGIKEEKVFIIDKSGCEIY